MAINYIVSYTFSPSTTISSSQVNTDFSDNANTWTGLEAKTKSFSNLVVDVVPTSATDVAIKSYVDKLNAYRRPVLQFGTVSTIAVESGLDGTSGDIPLLFPDGTLRTETSTTHTTFNITRNAVLVTSGAQSGLTGATSEASNTWYALYGVKVTDSSTLWVTVGSTVTPTQANFATLNSAYGANGWVYLGMVRNGDNSTHTADLLAFYQAGNKTIFNNTAVGNVSDPGILVASTAGATSLTYTYASGTGTTQIPSHLPFSQFIISSATSSGSCNTADQSGTFVYSRWTGTGPYGGIFDVVASSGFKIAVNSSVALDIFLSGFIDGALGIGANPIL